MKKRRASAWTQGELKRSRELADRSPQPFFNYTDRQWSPECTEERNGRWYIRIGFAGFNSPANNADGYVIKASAERACLRYQAKGQTREVTVRIRCT